MIGRQRDAPLLGQTVGAYHERPAAVPLQPFFHCAWIHSIPADEHASVIIVPDGCADLLFIDGELRIAGPDRRAKIERLVPGSQVIGLRFEPGALSAWLSAPAAAFADSRVGLAELLGSRAPRLAARLSDATDPEERLLLMQRALLPMLAGIEVDPEARRIFRRVQLGLAATGQVVAGLLAYTGLSERTLRRRCHESFGYGPKTLERILRLQKFLRLFRAAGSDGLAALAAGAGYADQSHLTREAAALTGLTPRVIAAHYDR